MTDQPMPRRHARATAGLLAAATAALLLMATGPTQAATVAVAARNYAFQPATRTITVGDIVRWTFAGDPHSVTSRDGLFDSGVTDPGGSFQFRFVKAGTYRYYCQVHPEQMFGTIVVRAASTTPRPTPRPTATPTPQATARATARPAATARPTATPTPAPTPATPAVASPTTSTVPGVSVAPSGSAEASPALVATPGPSLAAASPAPGSATPSSAADAAPILAAIALLVGAAVGGLLFARRRRAD